MPRPSRQRVSASAIAVESLHIEHGGSGPGIVTVTVGCALTDDAWGLIPTRNKAADVAYEAKHLDRRNQVHVAPT